MKPNPMKHKLQQLSEWANRHSKAILIGAFVLYIVIFTITAIKHEPWRDEAQAWLIARDNDLPGLWRMLGYEGHPILWFLLLYPFAHLGFPFQTMFVLHLLLNFVFIYLLLRHAPFPWWLKILLMFSYLFCYEFGIVARNYLLTVMFLFIFLIRSKNSTKINVSGIIALALAANTSVMGLISAGLLFLYALYGRLAGSNFQIFFKENWRWVLLFGLLAGVLPVLQLLPPADLGAHADTNFQWTADYLRTVPMSQSYGLGGTVYNLVDFWLGSAGVNRMLIFYVMAGFLSLLPIIALWRNKRNLIFYLISNATLLLLFLLKGLGGSSYRHSGFIFVFAVIFFWLGYTAFSKLPNKQKALPLTAFIVLLFCQIITTVYSVSNDWELTFSEGHAVANYLTQEGYTGSDYTIAGYTSWSMASIVAYLPGNSFYSLEMERLLTYTPWTNQYNEIQDPEELSRRLSANPELGAKKGLFITNRSFITDNTPEFRGKITLIKAFEEKTIAGDEIFRIYRINNQE